MSSQLLLVFLLLASLSSEQDRPWRVSRLQAAAVKSAYISTQGRSVVFILSLHIFSFHISSILRSGLCWVEDLYKQAQFDVNCPLGQ